jgi:SAM-dependent methyltransferase
MKKEYEEQYHRLEENHWWFRGRRNLVHSLVVQANPDRQCRILEMGCSGGPLIQQFQADGYAQVTGIDISPEAIELCKQRGLADTHIMDAQQLTFADEQFDVITASDVLEHLADAPRAIREWHRLLKPGGLLIAFVPAFQFLWSEHDEANKHYKRYRAPEIEQLLRENGFVVERRGYWNFSLFFPVTLVRLLKRLLPRHRKEATEGDLFAVPALLNNSLTWVLGCENRWLRWGRNFPFGISVMAIGRRRREAEPREKAQAG